MLQERMAAKHGVVRLDDRGRDLRTGPDGEGKLGFLAVIDRKTLEQQASKTRTSATADSVVDDESLETSAIVSQLTDAVESEIDDFLAHSVMAAGEIVGSIFLAGDQLLGVEELAVCASADLVNDGGLQIEEDSARDVLSGTSFGEKGVEGIVSAANGLVRGHLTIGLNTMLEAEELPARISDLDTTLSEMKAKNLAHSCKAVEYLGKRSSSEMPEVG